jgi:hypothetical protein
VSARGVLRIIEGGQVGFWCQGCNHVHVIPISSGVNDWQFNGDYDKPTFNPSVLVRYRHPKGHTNENPAPLGYEGEYVEDICHSFVRDGQIQFLADCKHALAGQTVALKPFG